MMCSAWKLDVSVWSRRCGLKQLRHYGAFTRWDEGWEPGSSCRGKEEFENGGWTELTGELKHLSLSAPAEREVARGSCPHSLVAPSMAATSRLAHRQRRQ